MSKRNPIFDMMKGIGILLMLIGHMGFPTWVNQFIYSFHMPLFFFLAGYFSPQTSTIPVGTSIRKHSSRLVLPYIVTMLMLIVWATIIGTWKHNYNMVIRHGLSLIWGSMDGFETEWGYIDNCPMWFLLALFWAKVIWDQLSKLGDKAVLYAMLLSVATIIVHKWIQLVPWSIMQGLSAVMFIAIGWFFNHHTMPKWLIALCIIVWPVAMVFSHMGMASMVYQCLPLDVVGSMGGTLVMYYLCTFLYPRTQKVESILCWCGMMSLTILCMSHFIVLSDIPNTILIRIPFIHDRMWINAIETPLCFVMATIVSHLPILNKIFR